MSERDEKCVRAGSFAEANVCGFACGNSAGVFAPGAGEQGCGPRRGHSDRDASAGGDALPRGAPCPPCMHRHKSMHPARHVHAHKQPSVRSAASAGLHAPRPLVSTSDLAGAAAGMPILNPHLPGSAGTHSQKSSVQCLCLVVAIGSLTL